jgi:hypothetical protein
VAYVKRPVSTFERGMLIIKGAELQQRKDLHSHLPEHTPAQPSTQTTCNRHVARCGLQCISHGEKELLQFLTIAFALRSQAFLGCLRCDINHRHAHTAGLRTSKISYCFLML